MANSLKKDFKTSPAEMEKPYVMTPKRLIDGMGELSAKAHLLYIKLYAQWEGDKDHVGFIPTRESIRNLFYEKGKRLSVDTIKALLKELKEAGYLEVKWERSEKKGSGGFVYILYNRPIRPGENSKNGGV